MEIRLSAFADEASADFSEQIRTLREERIPYIELRGVDGKNVSELTEADAWHCRELLERGGIRVWSIGSPLGKIGIRDDFTEHLKRAESIFRLASVFGTTRVRVFSFYTETPLADEEEVFARMRALCDCAQEFGVTLCHENEKEIYGDTPERCVRLLDHVPALRCVYDPANFVQCGADIVQAQALLAERADYFHIKDALYSDGAVVPAGCGDGDLATLLAKLARDTVLTLEPHLAVFDGYSAIDRTQLKNKYAFASPRAAFAAAAEALRDLLSKNSFREEGLIWTK